MAEHGELVEISADAFQLMKDRFEFLYLVDRLSECRDAKVFSVSHAGLCGDFFNGIPLAIGHPKGLFSVSFATLFGQSLSPLFLCKSGFGLPPEKIMRLAPAAFGGGSPNALLAPLKAGSKVLQLVYIPLKFCHWFSPFLLIIWDQYL